MDCYKTNDTTTLPQKEDSVPVNTNLDQRLLQAEQLFRAGDDAAAESLLLEARHEAVVSGDGAALGRAEIAMAEGALCADEDDLAFEHLGQARQLNDASDVICSARAWLVQSALRRRLPKGELPQAESAPSVEALAENDDSRPFAAWVCTECSTLARERGALSEAEPFVALALTLATEGSRGLALTLMEQAEIAAANERFIDADRSWREAMAIFERVGSRREQGRALLRYATSVSTHMAPETVPSPAALIGRAQAILGDAATWRDLSAMRRGYRHLGRRLHDQAAGEEVTGRIDAFEIESSHLRSAIRSAVGRADHSLAQSRRELREGKAAPDSLLAGSRAGLLGVLDTTRSQSKELRKAGSKLTEIIEAALVERNRMRSLLDVLSEVEAPTTYEDLIKASCQAFGHFLDADLLVIAKLDEGRIVELGRHQGAVPSPGIETFCSHIEGKLRPPSRSPRETDPQLRDETAPSGPVVVADVELRQLRAFIYADKLGRGGQFSKGDEQLIQLLADYFALAYARLEAISSERAALEHLSTTLETIRDGVISVDAKGVVTQLNDAAARMLHVEPHVIIGQSLDSAPALEPLVQILVSNLRIDSAMVKLPHGSFVITARPIRGGVKRRGVVATLVEFDRAQRLAQRVTATRPRYTFNDILTSSPLVQKAIDIARQASQVEASVLITGDSGTGKEVFAQAIHTGGERGSEAFVGVNCAAVPRELLEAELFGYDRGAFTGARAEGSPGKFEIAGNGTILLDEIGDMPLDMQAKLLRVLQERVVVRLGGSMERPVNTRVIATTHRDLDAMVKAGRFRHDLLYRLRVIHLHLPSLAARGNDVLLLATTFLERFSRQQNRRIKDFAPPVRQALLNYSWPGNIRELGNVIEREVSLLQGDPPLLYELATPLTEPNSRPSLEPEDAIAGGGSGILPLAQIERKAYLRALESCGGNVPKAAKALGVSKVTFYAKLRSWGMHPKDRP
ncbi:MAG: sigma 54-interacting transcriptional regulator [Myxococcota bacterium]|jgi:transcriptional regulator with PAS, ATPase and Fis domain|nr:sigma 54-interacting transcriptional regulator [Myxococcota bacterium]